MIITLLSAITILLFSEPTEQDEHAILRVKKTVDFELSGNGNSSNWDKTDWENIPQRSDHANIYVSRAKVLYSETEIYFLFYCEDSLLTSTFTEDNLKLWEEDVVEVFLWTDEKNPIYFEYQISPLNYQLTILVPNIDGNFLGWLPWQYEGDRRTRHKTSVIGGKKESGSRVEAWMAEFFIPYKLLDPLGNVPPESGTKWRANMYRIDHDQKSARRTFSWQLTEKTFHEYNKFGTFFFE